MTISGTAARPRAGPVGVFGEANILLVREREVGSSRVRFELGDTARPRNSHDVPSTSPRDAIRKAIDAAPVVAIHGSRTSMNGAEPGSSPRPRPAKNPTVTSTRAA
jgi:hypothetical protein